MAKKEEQIANFKEEIITKEELESKYLGCKIGTTIEITVMKIRKITVTDMKDPKADYCLSGEDFYYELDLADKKVFTIGAWKLWNAIRKVLDEAEKIEGTKLKIEHIGKGQYEVEVLE